MGTTCATVTTGMKVVRLVSSKLRNSSGHHDARCMVNVSGVCGDPTTSKTAGCVLAHWRFNGNSGGAQKPCDLFASFACVPCHNYMDSNGVSGPARGSEEWMFYAFRSMMRTQQWWLDNGFIEVK